LTVLPVAAQAWATFEQYLEYARNHDLEGIKSISHQLSAACKDQSRKAECDNLMDTAYFFGKDFKQSDFTHVTYDERQIIMSTDYMDSWEGADEPLALVLYFTRDNSESPKMLGMRFCVGEESKPEDKCVNTDPQTRDANKNGWWDDVEVLFK
jgi:hypothetical protein